VYRDEYYNPKSPDWGITKVIVNKHRKEQVSTMKLLLEP